MDDKKISETKLCACHKTKKRGEEEYKKLINRLNRIEGQIRGIKRMVENDAYCPDILVQAAAANAARKEAERAEREANADTYWTEDGRKIDGADRITARQIADEFSVSKKSVEKASRRGMIAKVYNTESRKHAVGYLRESAETWARAYKANVAAGGTRRRA